MEIETRLAALKADVAKATQSKLRADMEAEAALKARDSALETLSSDFGVSTAEEADRLLKSLEESLAQQLSEAENLLGDVT